MLLTGDFTIDLCYYTNNINDTTLQYSVLLTVQKIQQMIRGTLNIRLAKYVLFAKFLECFKWENIEQVYSFPCVKNFAEVL